jgi:hypothetical protein
MWVNEAVIPEQALIVVDIMGLGKSSDPSGTGFQPVSVGTPIKSVRSVAIFAMEVLALFRLVRVRVTVILIHTPHDYVRFVCRVKRAAHAGYSRSKRIPETAYFGSTLRARLVMPLRTVKRSQNRLHATGDS